MEESYQSNLSSDITEVDIHEALTAGMTRDVNLLRVLAAIQMNNLGNAYTNIGSIMGVLSPEKQEEFNTSVIFALNDVAHFINVAFGDEKEYCEQGV